MLSFNGRCPCPPPPSGREHQVHPSCTQCTGTGVRGRGATESSYWGNLIFGKNPEVKTYLFKVD